ncbi:hypothetical protein ABH930_007379, partial [Kitasatospora sp. GAS204A]|nr:hypothetical protein [Kitasatospora sp. GAS204B]
MSVVRPSMNPGPGVNPSMSPDASLTLRTITREEHLAFIRSLPSASHLQVPSWGEVKSEWRSESIGWIDASGAVVGAGL